MPAVKYDYDNAAQQVQPIHKTGRYKSVPLREVEKPAKGQKKAIDKNMALNVALLSLSVVLAVIFVCVYSVVAVSETKLANLHSQISDLNYENIELENKLENVKSYYSVDTKVSSTSSFEKAKNVLEVDRLDAKTIRHSEPKGNNLNTVTGF